MQKSKKNLFLLISILLIISIIILLAFGLIYNSIRNKILVSDNKQVEVLCEIYDGFLQNYSNCNITFDESAFRNFKTNEKFSDENIEKLKEYEKVMPSSKESYTLFVSGDPYVNSINLMLKNNGVGSSYQQGFTIKPGIFKITFKPKNVASLTES